MLYPNKQSDEIFKRCWNGVPEEWLNIIYNKLNARLHKWCSALFAIFLSAGCVRFFSYVICVCKDTLTT